MAGVFFNKTFMLKIVSLNSHFAVLACGVFFPSDLCNNENAKIIIKKISKS